MAVTSALVVTVCMLAACGESDSAGQAPPSDPVLARGEEIYRKSCAQCHGSKGGGGSGVKLAGVVAARYPDIADHIAVIADGKGSGRMPGFADELSPEDLEAVARWEREGF